MKLPGLAGGVSRDTSPQGARATAEAGWVAVSSSWVHSWRREPGALVVRFKHPKTGAITATCRYDDPQGLLAKGMSDAPSKGQYVHAALFHLDYKLL